MAFESNLVSFSRKSDCCFAKAAANSFCFLAEPINEARGSTTAIKQVVIDRPRWRVQVGIDLR